MPRSAGTYSLPAGQPVVAGTTISDTTFNTLTADIANELTNSIPRDGTAPPTANLPLGNFKITGLGNGTASNDAAAFGQLTATNTVNVPAGNIAAINVQAALNELDTEKAKLGLVTASGLTQSTARLLGRTTAATGAVEELSVGSKLSLSAGVLDSAVPQLQSVTCTQSGGALTFTLNPTVMDFRSSTLTTGVPTTVSVAAAISLTLPSGGTLGFPTTIQGRIYAVLMSNGELSIVSAAGGNDLSETGVISTTAISAGSTANNVFYSTTARTGLTYRIVGAVDAVNTAGAWGNPVLVQGAGGRSLINPSRYVSTAQTITSAGLLTLAHGLGAKPYRVMMSAICTTADAGYSIGDEVLMEPYAESLGLAAGYGVSTRIDATNIYVRFGSNTSPLIINNATTGVINGMTNGSWQLYVRAEL